MLKVISFLLFFLHLSSIKSASSTSDTLTPPGSISLNQTLVSAGEVFELGFFPANNNNNNNNKYYLGIWYFDLGLPRTIVWVANRDSHAWSSSDLGIWYFDLGLPRTIVWVANRDSHAWSSSVSLRINGSGRIVLSELNRSEFVFSSNHSQATSPILQLLDSGNLIVQDQANATSAVDYLWQSFDHPTDTLLPDQKAGWVKKTGPEKYLTSWKNKKDPSSGNYSFRLDRTGNPEGFLLKGNAQKIYRTGPWVRTRFGLMPTVNGNPTLNIVLYNNHPDEVYWVYNILPANQTVRFRLTVDPWGKFNMLVWIPNRKTWSLISYSPEDQCDYYVVCGPNALCNTSNNMMPCGCPEGFDHRNPTAWEMFGDGSEGCERMLGLECGTDTFVMVGDIKTPESGSALVYKEKGLEECWEMCREECNCTAYASWDVAHGVPRGCVMWNGDLVDTRAYVGGGQDLYIRVAASALGDDCISIGDNKFDCSSRRSTTKLFLGLSITMASMLVFIILYGLYQMLKRRNKIRKKKDNFKRNGGLLLQQQMHASGNWSIERTKIFTSSELEKATDDFNTNRVLGRGGQGTVYKGMLADGTIVAIKMSKKVSDRQSGQFINEVVILSQVSHRNVVKLLGCCLETDVPLLVYEYVPNGDLYQHIHNPSEDFFVTWKMRLQIAAESAEALAYLHSSSLLPIYHRDVKTSNILLDERYKAKVSDFGTSITLSVDQTHVTTGVQGTIGYMDPEFLQSNQYTEKSDVYSFGIVILELLTGKKPVYIDGHGEPRNLASESLLVMESSDLYDFVDARVSGEARQQEIEVVADLARRCLNLRGKERPTMKEIAMTLEMIRSQNDVPTLSRRDLMAEEEIFLNPICAMDGGFVSTFSSYAPR